MTNAEILQQLREAAKQKRTEYIIQSVKAKIARKTIKESIIRAKALNEDVTPAVSGLSAGGRTTTPSDVKKPGAMVGSASYAKYPDPSSIEDEVLMALSADKKYSGTDAAVVFLTGKGPGTYRQLLSDMREAEAAAAGAKDSAMTADSLIDAFQSFYPTLSPEEQKRVRGAARKFLLGFKRGLGGGIK
jgi:hypothetical protein